MIMPDMRGKTAYTVNAKNNKIDLWIIDSITMFAKTGTQFITLKKPGTNKTITLPHNAVYLSYEDAAKVQRGGI